MTPSVPFVERWFIRMKKQRLFYLDYIKAIATLIIFLTHYNALYLFHNPVLNNKVLLTAKISNIYIGDFGVSLFFIISGAALMHVYQEKINIKDYVRKRVLAIYPLFWLAFLMAFLSQFFITKGVNRSISLWKLVFTILGLDGYLSFLTPTFYLVGEWFLGFIIIFYIIFPILRLLINKAPFGTLFFFVFIYFITVKFYTGTFPKNLLLPTRIPELIFGMCFIKYALHKKIDWKMAIISSIVLVANYIFIPPWDINFQVTYIGISAFVLLYYSAGFFEKSRLKYIFIELSKYSYAIFLTHHFLIIHLADGFDLNVLSKFEIIILFVLCFIVTIIMSWILTEIHRWILQCIKSYKLRPFLENR